MKSKEQLVSEVAIRYANQVIGLQVHIATLQDQLEDVKAENKKLQDELIKLTGVDTSKVVDKVVPINK